jgi:CubicO group peptidase (beta-lactamase class C family)
MYAPEFLSRHRAEMLQNFEDLANASSSTTALWLLIGEDLMLSFFSPRIPKSRWGRIAPTFVLLVVVFGIWRAFAYDIAPVKDPRSLEFSQARLARIAAWQQTQVDAGAISGAVSAVARNGKVAYLQAVGFRDRAKTIPLQSDAIFWIASMTKPVTSVAAMMLVEEGKLDLAAPVHQYLPELKDMMVGVERADPVTGQSRLVLEPQKRPMTVEDLLRHTSGLTYFDQGNTAGHGLYRELYEKGLARESTLKDFVSRLARLPLVHQPGEVWEYGHSTDVLGRVVEVASGQSLDRFFESRLFRPLGMVDTGFSVPPEKIARLIDPPVGAVMHPDREITKPTTLFSGGGGLVSTAADYLRFCQMLLNGGELDGVRILSSATVSKMTTDALPPDVRFTGGGLGWQGGGTFGLGFGIRSNATASWVPGSVGSFTWSGAWGTRFWVDPAEQLIAIQLIQVTKDYDRFTRSFRNLTYGAFLVPDQGVPASPAAAIDQAALEDLVGKYDFGQSSSSRDKMAPTNNNFFGIGADIELTGSGARIRQPLDNSPSAQAGLKPGDIITEIDDVPVRGLTLAQIIAKLRGPINSQTRLKISRAQDAPIEVAVTRAPIYIPSVELQVKMDAGTLVAEATGPLPILDFEKGKPVRLQAISGSEFFVDGLDHTRIIFERDQSGKAASAVLNPGQWEQRGRLIARRAS